jgi:hypothetical protein
VGWAVSVGTGVGVLVGAAAVVHALAKSASNNTQIKIFIFPIMCVFPPLPRSFYSKSVIGL